MSAVTPVEELRALARAIIVEVRQRDEPRVRAIAKDIEDTIRDHEQLIPIGAAMSAKILVSVVNKSESLGETRSGVITMAAHKIDEAL